MTLTGPQQPLRPFVSWKQSLCPELDMIKMSQTVKKNWNEGSSKATFKQVILPLKDCFFDFIKQKKLRKPAKSPGSYKIENSTKFNTNIPPRTELILSPKSAKNPV